MAAEVYFTGENPVFGNKRMAVGTITMSGLVSGAADVGLGYITGGSVSLRSHTANTSYTVGFNTASGGTSANGFLRIRSAVAGDVFDIMVWGR